MASVRTIEDGMTYNPDTGSHTVRDVAGHYIGSTTDPIVAENWYLYASACKSRGADPAPTRIDFLRRAGIMTSITSTPANALTPRREGKHAVPLIDRALAYARRDAYFAAAAMTSAELQAGVREYQAAVGPATGEALTQLRMIRTVIAMRRRSPRSRSRAAAEFRRARAARGMV